jgi:hypothetical protein
MAPFFQQGCESSRKQSQPTRNASGEAEGYHQSYTKAWKHASAKTTDKRYMERRSSFFAE